MTNHNLLEATAGLNREMENTLLNTNGTLQGFRIARSVAFRFYSNLMLGWCAELQLLFSPSRVRQATWSAVA